MTEIYRGPWSPTRGDVPEEKVQDAYHRYLANKQVEVLINEPLTGAYKVRPENIVISSEGNVK